MTHCPHCHGSGEFEVRPRETAECPACHGTGIDLDDLAAGLLDESAAALEARTRDDLVRCYAVVKRLFAGPGSPSDSDAVRDAVAVLATRCRVLLLLEQAEHLDRMAGDRRAA